jgi:hypothetical protein
MARTKEQRIADAVLDEMAKLGRIKDNIERACEMGLITQHDRDERIARWQQWTDNRIAHLRSEPRPPQRKQQPLDDPDAGKVG